MEATSTKISLKLLIDTKAKKVIFAEAGKDFVDFLFYLLALPVSTVIRLLKAKTMVGCIGNLYQSIEDLNETYMQQPDKSKNILLKPSMAISVANVCKLLPDHGQSSQTQTLYACYNHKYVSYLSGTKCPGCNYMMSTQMNLVGPANIANSSSTGEGGFVKDLVTYMVTDDLSVTPLSMISGVTMLNKCNVTQFDVLQERVVEFGINEGLKLLEASLQSKAALTYVFLHGGKEVKNAASAL